MPSHRQAFAATVGLNLVELEDGLAVFNPLSWETHLLNGAAAAVLHFLDDSMRTEAEVASLLDDVLEDSSRPEAAAHAAAILGNLLRLRLIQSKAV